MVFGPDIKNLKDFIRAFTVGKIQHTTFVAKAVLNIKIEKRVYDVTATLIFAVEQNEHHIRTQRPKIYTNQCKNLLKIILLSVWERSHFKHENREMCLSRHCDVSISRRTKRRSYSDSATQNL